MRTTLNTIFTQINANLNTITTQMADINNRMSSGRQFSKISDNPLNLVFSLNMRTAIAEIDQYQENLQYGDTMITAAESALTQIKGQITEAKTIAIEAQNPAVAANRSSIAPKVSNLLDQAVTLANSRINGKYIFGGTRTSGYTDAEPAPFIKDLIDGYRLNGSQPSNQSLIPQPWTVQDGTDLAAGDLEFVTAAGVTVPVGAVDLTNAGATTYGINMTDTWNLRTGINLTTATSAVTATSTTQVGGGTAATASAGQAIDFDLTGSVGGPINITYTASGTATEIAQQTVAAINNVSSLTGIMALRGNGSNGGIADSVVLRNSSAGDEGAITITGLPAAGAEATVLGFDNTDSVAAADATHNSGQIHLSSPTAFTFGTTTAAVLGYTGLDNSTIAPSALDSFNNPSAYDNHYNGTLDLHDLKINGIWVPAASADGISNVMPTFSATAKAAAINSVSSQTGVTAEITSATVLASSAVEAGTMNSGDLIINGVDIFTAATTILTQDSDNTLLDGINAQQGVTGVAASRDSDGKILLKTMDGRNLHVESSANSEAINHINGTNPTALSSEVYIGRVQLLSSRTFMLESPIFGQNNFEAGLVALGLDGGTLTTGEASDVANDGKVSALTIADLDGNIRYAGDQEGVLDIKVGKIDTLAISQNGQIALKDTQAFNALRNLEEALRGINYTHVTSVRQATDVTATLDSGSTGLSDEAIIMDGKFTVTVTDHDHSPPEDFTMTIGVDVSEDSPSSIAAKINGVPNISAGWNSDGYLAISTSDSSRFSFAISEDSSQFTKAIKITPEDMQVQAIDDSIAELDTVFDSLTTQISDFGARANRITVQTQIFDHMLLANKENLSEKQDTDLTKAVLDMKAVEVAYQAALSAAAKTMRLSLVDYLQ